MLLRLPRVLVLSAVCISAFAAPALATSEWVITRMSTALRADVSWEQVRSQMMATYYLSNPDARGVNAAGIDNLRQIDMAHRRSHVSTQILNHDLNGDGVVTKDEITASMQPRARRMISANGVQMEPTPQQVRQQLDKLISDALKPDANGDDVISADEIKQEAQKQAQAALPAWNQQNLSVYVPMTLDADGDGFVSLSEYEAAVRSAFDLVDKDRDGRVSVGEFGAFGPLLNEARQMAQRARDAEIRKQQFEAAAAGCKVPAAPTNARLVLLGARDARALSDAWIGTEDKVTYVTTVEIAPGHDPVFLALASASAMIWDIVGATERIAGIVAHSETDIDSEGGGAARRRTGAAGSSSAKVGGQPLVGVMGVARDKVHFTAHKGCLVPATEETMKDGTAQQMATLLLGRAADDVGGEQTATAFRVTPLMHQKGRQVRNAMLLPEVSLGAALWRETEESFTAGIARIDVESVISVHPVKPYTVLPLRAGLAALVDGRALEIAGVSRGIRLNAGSGEDFKPFTSPDKFRVTEKIRLPAGATGTFILQRDVPVPDGDLSRVCILSATDMKPLAGERRGRC